MRIYSPGTLRKAFSFIFAKESSPDIFGSLGPLPHRDYVSSGDTIRVEPDLRDHS